MDTRSCPSSPVRRRDRLPNHFRQIATGRASAHAELSADLATFWDDHCLMCGVEAVPDRLCENVDCKKLLHPQWPAVYCCNECALEDM